MIEMNPSSVYDRRSLFVWALFCILAGLIFLVYALTSLTLGRGVFVMPLDDVYIHFQYAKQLAFGQLYIYNPGLPPTSGATSFLYPYMLAVGYLLGFQGLNLGLWAMLLGMVALAYSTWLVYRLVKVFDAPEWLAILVGIVFALSGPVSWHFMSGMETGWVVLFTLGTLYSLTLPPEQKNIRNTVISATLLALIRPEGGILAGLAMMALFLRWWRHTRMRYLSSLLIPILAIGIQPLVNLLLTGSAVASGNAAKSVFGMIPFSWNAVIGRILSNWGQMWSEFFTGSSPREGLYITPLMLTVAIIGLLSLLRNKPQRIIGLTLIGWLAFGTLAISTLDTAFWHFKRYQIPFMALLFPLASWGLLAIGNVWRQVKRQSPYLHDPKFVMTSNVEWGLNSRIEVLGIFVAVGIAYTLITSFEFLYKYELNVGYVYQQPLQMARWLQANTPSDAVIAVHDVGMMRYMGGRTTLDMVGLTTPGAADYWRNGPGSVAEFLIANRPDYIASYGYGHGFGLGMLADTDLYGEPLVSFPVDLDPNYNVALAANFQGIYRPDWTASRWQGSVIQSHYASTVIAADSLNVANLEDEAKANYRWSNNQQLPGFPTEVHELDYLNCPMLQDCHFPDGGRTINGEESFTLQVYLPDYARLMLVTRLLPTSPGKIDIYEGDKYVATQWIPSIPGHWMEIATLLPESEWFTCANPSVKLEGSMQDYPSCTPVPTDYGPIKIRIVPHIEGGYYMPYYHWLIQGEYEPEHLSSEQLTDFQNGAIVLASAKMEYQAGENQMPINIDWYTDGSAQGDYKVFVHMLDKNDQIVAQADTYPGNGTLPPGNWLPGILHDRIMVDLNQVPAGIYRVAIGLYNPYTFERLQPTGGDDQNRFFIGDVEIR